jgi:hypothetical protein
MALLKTEYLQETVKELHLMVDLWQKVRDFLKIARSNEPITKEHEAEFLRVKSEGSKYHRILKRKLTDKETRIKKLDFPYDNMIEILRGSISIAHLRGLPEADQKKLQSDWHKTFIGLCTVAGAYEFLSSDQINLARAAKRTKERTGLLGKVTGVFRRGKK